MIEIYDEKRGIFGTISSLRMLADIANRKIKKGDMKAAGEYAELGFEMWERIK